MDNKVFAPGYPRNEEGWVLFPKDAAGGLRQKLFPPEAMAHPAKYNFSMIEEIIEYVSEPGDTIMDIMAGTGTIMIAALSGRNVICIEIEKPYQEVIKEARKTIGIATNNSIVVLEGDCRDFLPVPTNHIIFSPPYAMILKTKTAVDEKWKTMHRSHKDQNLYSGNMLNVGNLNKFMYNQAMEKIYGLCYDSVLPGGTMTVVIKDYINNGKRVYLSSWVIRVCSGLGFIQTDWFKRESTGSGYQDMWRSKGGVTVDDEDIIIFRRVR